MFDLRIKVLGAVIDESCLVGKHVVLYVIILRRSEKSELTFCLSGNIMILVVLGAGYESRHSKNYRFGFWRTV